MTENAVAPSKTPKVTTSSFIWLIICSICWAIPPAISKLLTEDTHPMDPWFIA